ncbi:MAG: arginine repressor [Clostridia bacterium]|nr:arginine repressor [Clostridia bacterium]NCC74893.1 arginine repressor [Clostridia bacterium]
MRTDKIERQARLLQLIRDKDLATQDELVLYMRSSGMDVTQATVSRDIKELGIVKVMTGTGTQKYVSMQRTGESISGRLMKIYAESVLSVDLAMNLIVIKTMPGMAQACASALDSMRLSDLVGTLAGDDTVFIATRSAEQAQQMAEVLSRLIAPGFGTTQPSEG